MSFPYINRVAVERAHSEFYNYIERFPGQEKLVEKLEAMERELPLREQKLDFLRAELRDLARDPQSHEEYLCYRTCFKEQRRGLVDFCLQQRCAGASFAHAAERLGLARP